MFLSIYVYRQLGLTLDLTADRPVLPQACIREGPAFSRLTAEPDRLRDPGRLHHWLAAFLPENATIVPYRQHARRQRETHGVGSAHDSAAGILWGNADVEYTGAIDFRQTDRDPPERLPERCPAAFEPLSEAAIGARLELAARISDNAPRTRPAELLALSGRRASLSGMHGKCGIVRTADGRWAVPLGESLSTWVCKHEHRAGLPGEAGVEAVCQRALALAGIPAALTTARVFDGVQAVLSRRSDRVESPGRRVEPRHQEEWIQAACHPPDDKYDDGRGRGPQWPDAYHVLRERSPRPDAETAVLTRILACGAWMLGNGDMHRRNVGFLHTPAGDAPGVGLAPLYDASSAAGTRYDKGAAVALAGVMRPEGMKPVHWTRLSHACRIPPDDTVAILDDLFRTLPDALATAHEQARETDEVLSQAAVDLRVERVIRYVQGRERQYRQRQRGAARKQRERAARGGDASGRPSADGC